MFTSGGRLFVDVTQQLGIACQQRNVIRSWGNMICHEDALMTIERRNFIKSLPEEKKYSPSKSNKAFAAVSHKSKTIQQSLLI